MVAPEAVLAAVDAARSAARVLMLDTCTITRGTSGSVYDPTSDSYTHTPGTTVYSGPCRVKARDNVDHVADAGEQSVSFWPYLVSVPMSAVGIDLDDTVTVTASSDPDLVGKTLRVRAVPGGALMSARRLGCEEQA